MDIRLYLSFVIASAIVLVVPGPTIITVISQSVRHGSRSTMPLITGVFLGDFLAMTLSLMGLGSILQKSIVIFTMFRWAGAAYLVYLGIQTLRKKHETIGQESSDSVEGRGTFSLFQTSFLVTILNPKSITFFIAFFPQFIQPTAPVYHQMIILGSTFLVLSIINASSYSVFACRIERFMKEDRIRRRLDRISGGILIAAGIVTAAIEER